MTNPSVVPLHEEARIEAALRYDDSENQLAFAEGYERAMIIAARRANLRPVEPKAKPEFTGFVRCAFDGGEPMCAHEGYSGLSKNCPDHGSVERTTGKS